MIEFYRKKGYVFCCIKVTEAQLQAKTPVDLHPLRFTFKTGGRDGIYFPMKLSGLQKQPFDVNLYGSTGSRMRGGLKKTNMLVLIGVTTNKLQERDQHVRKSTLPCIGGSRL